MVSGKIFTKSRSSFTENLPFLCNDLDLFSFQTNSIKKEDEVLQDDFLIKEFQKSIGAKSIIEEQPNENNIEGIEEEFKELLNDYIKKFPEDVEWPLNLSNFKKENLTSEIPDMNPQDKQRFNELGKKIFEHKMNTFENCVQMNKDALVKWWDILLFIFQT